MTKPIALDDVEPVSEFELALPMKLLIDAERALCLMRGSTIEDRRIVETAFWDSFNGSTRRGVAILVRFWCLVDAFSAKRFKTLLLSKGYQLIAPAVAAAAELRLNANWGFNPQRLLWAIDAQIEQSEKPQARRPGKPAVAVVDVPFAA